MKAQLTLDTLAEAVLAMREAQKDYFRAPTGPEKQAKLTQARAQEAEVDRIIGAWQQRQAQKQPDLFDGCC